MITEQSLSDSMDRLSKTVLDMKADRDRLAAKVAKYEACYNDIVAYIERANDDDGIGIPEMYGEVMDRLDVAFDVKAQTANAGGR